MLYTTLTQEKGGKNNNNNNNNEESFCSSLKRSLQASRCGGCLGIHFECIFQVKLCPFLKPFDWKLLLDLP